MSPADTGNQRPTAPLLAVRYGLPLAIVLAGITLMALGEGDALTGAGVVLIGVALLVALLNVLMRLGIESQRDRQREEEARREFSLRGRWPRR